MNAQKNFNLLNLDEKRRILLEERFISFHIHYLNYLLRFCRLLAEVPYVKKYFCKKANLYRNPRSQYKHESKQDRGKQCVYANYEYFFVRVSVCMAMFSWLRLSLLF